MIEWFKKKFHLHEYSILETINIVSNGSVIGTCYPCRCRVCGKIKRFEV